MIMWTELFLACLLFGASAETYNLSTTISLDPAGSIFGHGDWVAYDSDTETVWLSHQPDSNVVVLDALQDRIRVILPNVKSGNGITFNRIFAFVADYDYQSVLVYHKRNYYLVQNLSTPGGPDGVYWDTVNKALWVALDDSKTIARFSSVVGWSHEDHFVTHRLPFQPNASANITLNTTVNPSAGPDVGVYVSEYDRIYQPIDALINVIDTKEKRIIATWSLPPGSGNAKGISYDSVTRHLVLGTSTNKVFIVSAVNGSVAATIPVPGAIDASFVDSVNRRAFFGDKTGVIDVINLDTNTLLQSFLTHISAHTLAVKCTSPYKVWSYFDQANAVGVFLRN